MKKSRLWLSVCLIGFIQCSFLRKIEKIPEYTLKTIIISATAYKLSKNIYTEQDSARAIAMILNRECPTCSQEEKIYVASCIVTGSKSLKVSWKTYLFKKGQFWGFKDSRVKFDPKHRNHRNNLLAAESAWRNPKHVRFYATEIDGKHFDQVKKKGFTKPGFYQYYAY